MAGRKVTSSMKDSEGDILALCNSSSDWSPRWKAQAIADIEGGHHTYYVQMGSNRVDIHVVNGPTGKYLRTDPDVTDTNNLDDLPDC